MLNPMGYFTSNGVEEPGEITQGMIDRGERWANYMRVHNRPTSASRWAVFDDTYVDHGYQSKSPEKPRHNQCLCFCFCHSPCLWAR